jgi:hypothetical protein
MVGLGEGPHVYVPPQAWTALAVACLMSFLPALAGPFSALRRRFVEQKTPAVVITSYATAMVLVFLSAAALAKGAFNPFIYFRF